MMYSYVTYAGDGDLCVTDNKLSTIFAPGFTFHLLIVYKFTLECFITLTPSTELVSAI